MASPLSSQEALQRMFTQDGQVSDERYGSDDGGIDRLRSFQEESTEYSRKADFPSKSFPVNSNSVGLARERSMSCGGTHAPGRSSALRIKSINTDESAANSAAEILSSQLNLTNTASGSSGKIGSIGAGDKKKSARASLPALSTSRPIAKESKMSDSSRLDAATGFQQLESQSMYMNSNITTASLIYCLEFY